MTESFIPVQGTGKNLETSELTDSNGKVVHREGVFIGDPTDVDARVNVYSLADGDYAIKAIMVNSAGVPFSSATTPSGGAAIDIHDAHVHTQIVNRIMHQNTATETTLTVAVVGDGTENTITVASTAGFSAGGYIHLNGGAPETTHPRIISVVGAVITLDRYIDFPHALGASVVLVIVDMASQVASLASPQRYSVGPVAGEVWHIMRLIFEMTHGTAGDFGLFGNVTSLTNGVILRAKNSGQWGTLTNWKNNGDIASDLFDVSFNTRSGGGGAYGTGGRGTFYDTGAVVRLDGDEGDIIELIVQDDITGLDNFTMKMQGHIEGQ